MENKNPRKNLDLGDLRERLQLANGPDYWRSLEELAQTDDGTRSGRGPGSHLGSDSVHARLGRFSLLGSITVTLE